MIRLKNSIRQYCLLKKQLLHKKSFIAILLLVPLLVTALGMAAGNGDSGVLTVALTAESSKDEIAWEIVEKLMTEERLIRFFPCTDKEEAARCVQAGEADAAWIFHGDILKKADAFVSHAHTNNALVTVIQREDSVALRLSREKLNAVLYPYLSYALFSSDAHDRLEQITEMELKTYYQSVDPEGEDLFTFMYAGTNTENEAVPEGQQHFLLSPLRGLLAIMIVLGGMAAAMYYMQHEASGFFDRFSKNALFPFSILHHAAAVTMVGTAVFGALHLAQISVGWGYELLVLTLYCAAAVGFCLCLRLILFSIRLFASLAPVLIVVMTVFCPILFQPPRLPAIQFLLPTYYYLNAFSNRNFVWYMALYCIAAYTAAYLLHLLRSKRYR